LYANGRSFDALPFGRANLALAGLSNDAALKRRAHTALGLLLGDTADIAGAIDQHTHALLLTQLANDAVEMSRVWNNIGLALAVSGSFALAVACFRRVLALLHAEPGPVYSRYTALTNLAHSLYHLDRLQEGLDFAALALAELTSDFSAQDPHGALLLHRNCAKLHLGVGDLPNAAIHVEEVQRRARSAATPRGFIAAATTRAAYEMTSGDHDLALTRLDQALAMARSVPATLRDTLVSVIRAEEKAGLSAQALIRLQELSDHIYRNAVLQIRQHIELAEFIPLPDSTADYSYVRTKTRLTSHLSSPRRPAEWATLQRLAAGTSLRVDSTARHGERVGVLTRALALEYGLSPIEALEYGLAAELHDIGMAAVPEGVLMQAGALNDVEHSLVRKHTAAGAEMLAGDQHPRLMIACDMAKYHHARWDGEGYPSAVAGRAIPLAARMCAVADSYDAMATDRPYRKASTMDKALTELRRVGGTHLDPDLVRCFEVVIRREAENEGIDPCVDSEVENFQQLITSLKEDRGFL
jgi:putative two-component system response regulator